MRQLPSLKALQVFEAVARYLSFQQAAQELGVTPTAVSHQIKLLETELGVSLFCRHPRPITLTEAGQQLYPTVKNSLNALANGVSQIKQQQTAFKSLTVNVVPVFAAKWLVPRLLVFQQTYPEVDLRLQASQNGGNLQSQIADVAIRYGQGHYPGWVVHPLMSDTFGPVCSPRFLEGENALQTPNDLVNFPLLHFDGLPDGQATPNWKNWLVKAGAKTVKPDCGAKFNDESLAIQAAIAGQGVALCSNIHVADDIALGFLAQPFELTLEGFHYSAVYHPNHPKESLILEFVSWLVTAAQGSTLEISGYDCDPGNSQPV